MNESYEQTNPGDPGWIQPGYINSTDSDYYWTPLNDKTTNYYWNGFKHQFVAPWNGIEAEELPQPLTKIQSDAIYHCTWVRDTGFVTFGVLLLAFVIRWFELKKYGGLNGRETGR